MSSSFPLIPPAQPEKSAAAKATTRSKAPASGKQASPPRPSGKPVAGSGLQPIGGPDPAAPPAPPLPTQRDPNEMPFVHSMEGGADPGAFMTDREFLDDFLKDNHTIPTVVLLAAGILALAIGATKGYYAADMDGYIAGTSGAIGGLIGGAFVLAIGALTATAAGWLVSKIFGEEYGSLGALLLRFSAVFAAGVVVFEAMNYALGFWPAMLFSFPVQCLVVMWVAGLDFIKALVFNVLLTLINWMLLAFVIASFGVALA